MQAGFWSTRSAVVVMALLATTLVGCSEENLEAKETGFATSLSKAVGVAELDDGWTTFDGDTGRLVLPQLSIQLDRVKRADSLSAAECEVIECELGDDDADGIQAADGEDLVAVVFAAPQQPAAAANPYPTVEAKIEAEDLEVATLTQLKIGYAASIVVSVPEDTDRVDLTVTQEDAVPTPEAVTATMDVLTGEPADDAQRFAPYLDLTPVSVQPARYVAKGTMVAQGRNEKQQFPFRVNWEFGGSLSWQQWQPALGWAKPGRAWLVLSRVNATMGTSERANVSISDYQVKPESSFVVTSEDGERIGAMREPTMIVSSYVYAPFQIVWDVPADLTAGKITVEMAGEPSVNVWSFENSAGVRTDWVKGKQPEPFEFEFDLAAP